MKVSLFLILTSILALVLVVSVYLLSVREGAERAIATCASKGDAKISCYEELVVNVAKKRGVAAGLDILASIYASDRDYVPNCHSNTHDLGAIAYNDFKKNGDIDLSTKMSYCGFGYYHGFIEELMSETGSLDGAKKFCGAVDEKLSKQAYGVVFGCYHGIGHGVVADLNPALETSGEAYIEPGIKLCGKLGDDGQHRERCASGVFNALALAYFEPGSAIVFNENDPFAICRTQTAPVIKKACYDQMNTIAMRLRPEMPQALALVRASSEPAYIATAIAGTADIFAAEGLAKGMLTEHLSACAALPKDNARSCAEGYAAGMIEFGKPGSEYQAAVDACVSVPDIASSCLLSVARSVYDRLPPSDKATLCTLVKEKATSADAQRCLDVMSGRAVNVE